MRSLLCGLLSILLVVNSTLPSFAQAGNPGRAIVRVVSRRPTLLQQGLRIGGRTAGITISGANRQLSRMAANISSGSNRSLSQAVSNLGRSSKNTSVTFRVQQQTFHQVAQMQRQVPQAEQYHQWAKHSQISSLSENFASMSGRTEKQSELFRNEGALAILTKQVDAEQALILNRFYKSDIQRNLFAFTDFSDKSFTSLVSDTSKAPIVKAAQNAFSSASALALTGSAKDAPVLISLYNAAKGTPFEQVATRLTGRGLLKMKAYDAFNAWADPLTQEGEFWLGLTAYARRNHLPVRTHASVGSQSTMEAEGMVAWLEEGNLANGLNADDSLLATESWMALGEQAELKESAALQTVTDASASELPTGSVQVGSVSENILSAPLADLQLAPIRLPVNETPVAQPKVGTPATAAPVPSATTANSGVLYSGLPIFALGRVVKKAWNKVRTLFSKERNGVAQAVTEEPGLHENTVRPVYEPTRPSSVLDSEDAIAFTNYPSNIEVAESGFKLTLENDAAVEHILHHVNLSVDAEIQTAGYNRVVLRQDRIFELRNLTQPAGEMSRFFFELSNANGELYKIASFVTKNPFHRPMRIKLEQKPNRRYSPVILRVEDFDTGNTLNVQASVDAHLVLGKLKDSRPLSAYFGVIPQKVKNGKLLLARDGKIYFEAADGERVLLEGYHLRLPKEESRMWMTAMQSMPETQFNLQIHSTSNKTNFMTYAVSPLRIGTGKAFGPIMSSMGLAPFLATGIPLFVNNGLTVLLGPAMPLLRRLGEANMYRLGVGLYAFASTGALALGLNGFMGVENATALQIGGLIGVLTAMGLGGVLINVTQNNLVSANVGAIKAARSKIGKLRTNATGNTAPTISYLGSRLRQMFSKGNVEMRDSVRYQWLSAFKNVGTFGFLSLPFLFNLASKAMGSSVRADFSLSFWALAGLSTYALAKVLRMPLKDSVPRNATVLQKMVVETEHDLIPAIEKELLKPVGERDFLPLAKRLNEVLKPYARAASYRMPKDQRISEVDLEGKSLERLQKNLLDRGMPEDQAKAAITQLQSSLNTLSRRNVNFRDVMKMKGVKPALGAMTLLTIHELGTASEFAYQVKELAKQQFGTSGDESMAMGMFLTAFFLYGTAFFSRIGGNWIALRTSEGSMYAFSSAMSVLGTSMLIAANGNMPMLFTGAIMATFGMGNFFSQIFEYTMKQAPKFRPELAVLISYTMPLAAGLSAGIHSLAEWGATHGINELGLMTALGALVASFAVCPKMFADSSLIRSAKYYSKKAWTAVKNMFRSKGNPPAGNSTPLTDGMRAGVLKY